MHESTVDKTAEESRTPLCRSDDPHERMKSMGDSVEMELLMIRSLVARVAAPASDEARAVAGGGPVTPGRPGSSSVQPAKPLDTFWAYVNGGRDADWNTCGQAAIASMLDYYHADLGIPRTRGTHWSTWDAIDRVKELGFGPDVVFGWGTTPDRIKNALTSLGVGADVGHSGLFFSGWAEQWNRLLAYVYYSAIPVPVLVDMGMLGGPGFSAHWPIVWRMDYSASGMRLHLANWSPSWTSNPIPQEKFLQAWAARQLPLGMNHAAVYTGKPRIRF